MRLNKKIIAFVLLLTMLLSVQAMGFSIKGLYVKAAGDIVNKNHPGVVLQNVYGKQLNPDYVSVENNILERNNKQIIKVGLSVDLTNVKEASLRYQLEGSDKVLLQNTSDIKNGFLTFVINVASNAVFGKYNLLDTQLSLEDGTVLDNIDLKQMAVAYAVVADKSKEIELNNKATIAGVAQTVETPAIVGVNKDKNITSDDIGKAIAYVKKSMKSEDGQGLPVNTSRGPSNTVFADSGITIVLDPGHGGSESGAVAGGYLEKDLNLKIAQYAKEELDTYSGVTVGMTRTSDTYLGLQERADVAKQQGANILVSMHNNSSGTGETYGSEVFVSVLNAYNETSTVMGNIILDQLSALGLYDRGVKVRPSETGTIFTLTGELADYYGVIKAAAYFGFPGIIIEHTFMDNPTEAQNYLSTDYKLKQLGVADATALAKYYGLVKKPAVLNGWFLENGQWHYYKYGTLLANSWKSDSQGWCYLDSNGNLVKGALIKDSTGLCFIGTNGYWSAKSTGWKMDSFTNKWAFIGRNGYALKNAWVQDYHGWCYLDSEGYWLDHAGIANDSLGSCIIGDDGYWTGARN